MIKQIIIKYTNTSINIKIIAKHTTINRFINQLEDGKVAAMWLTQYIDDTYGFSNGEKQDKSVKLDVAIDRVTDKNIKKLPEFIQTFENLLNDSLKKELAFISLEQQKLFDAEYSNLLIIVLKIDFTSIALSFGNNKIELQANSLNRQHILKNVITEIKSTFNCEMLRITNFIAFIIKNSSEEEVEKQSNRIFQKLK